MNRSIDPSIHPSIPGPKPYTSLLSLSLSLFPAFRAEIKSEKIGDRLRVVEIDGLDVTPCGGSHLTNTAEMQLVKIVSVVKDRGSVRLVFIAGNRVMARLTESLASQVRSIGRLVNE